MIAKVVCLCAALAVAQSSLVHTGASTSARQQDDFGNYAFKYSIADGAGATNGRYEVGDGHGNTKGAYTLTDIDGRARRVEYVADGHGFRAAVKTNEPGTAASAPAAVLIASPYAGPAAPIAVGHSVAAPVYAGALGYGGHSGYAGAYGYASHLGYGAKGFY